MTLSLSKYSDHAVLDFYRDLPFNYRHSASAQADYVRRVSLAKNHPLLWLKLGAGGCALRILEMGCGSGQLAAAIALHTPHRVTAIDFNPVAIARATEVAKSLSLERIRFEVADLHNYSGGEFDITISYGVLHHTRSVSHALRHIASHCLAAGGHLYLGLYHKHGRAPFTRHFERLKRAGLSERELFLEYQRLHGASSDGLFVESWFRDQVLHPLESTHTLSQVNRWAHSSGLTLAESSLSEHASQLSRIALNRRERLMGSTGRRALKEGRYYPGFFTALYKKTS